MKPPSPYSLASSAWALSCLRQAQIVEAEIGRKVRLGVALEERLRLCDVRPLCETFAPPGIVLCRGMKLREVVRNEARLGAQKLNVLGGHGNERWFGDETLDLSLTR